MSAEPKKHPEWRRITYPVERAELSARLPPDDGGPWRVLLAVVDVMMEREGCGKQTDLVRSLVGLTELLTDEQRAELPRQLAERQAAGKA